MNNYGIKVPFPEEMTQQDYDDLYYKQTFYKNFNIEEYERCCDVLDNVINELLNGKEEVFIEDKDVYKLLHINYAETKKELLKAKGINLECTRDVLNNGFRIKVGE